MSAFVDGVTAVARSKGSDDVGKRPVPDFSDSYWTQLVERIRAEDPTATEELYGLFSRGIRYFISRQLGVGESDDKVHDTFLIVLQAIRRGDLRDPRRLMGFIRTVVRRQVAAHIDHAVQARREHPDLDLVARLTDLAQNPEESAMGEQQAAIIDQILRGIAPRDREILIRYYLREEPQDQICADMNLSENQFRLLKSRAKARFCEIGRRRFTRRPIGRFFVRKSAGA